MLTSRVRRSGQKLSRLTPNIGVGQPGQAIKAAPYFGLGGPPAPITLLPQRPLPPTLIAHQDCCLCFLSCPDKMVPGGPVEPEAGLDSPIVPTLLSSGPQST